MTDKHLDKGAINSIEGLLNSCSFLLKKKLSHEDDLFAVEILLHAALKKAREFNDLKCDMKLIRASIRIDVL